MIEILRFASESLGHFCIVCFLISICGGWLSTACYHLGKIGRPRKTISIAETHKL